MKTLLLLLAFSAGPLASKPNIIVVLVDDMGFSDLGCYGSGIETPHLDSLAENGLRFIDFHNTARCCPTRASLLTGLYPHQAGVGLMTKDEGKPGYRGRLNENCITVAEALKPAGYATLMTGKWHVGDHKGHHPTDRGFDRFWGSPGGGGFYFKEAMLLKNREIFLNDQKIDPPDGMYVTDDFTDRAIEFIDEAVVRTKKPFFLYLAHIAPHWPLQAKPEDIAKYKGRFDHGWDREREIRFEKQKSLGVVSTKTRLSPRDPSAEAWASQTDMARKDLAHRMEIYAAQIDSIDQNIGKLVSKLKELGQFENNLILFLSDNGCSSEGGPGGFNNGKQKSPIGTAPTHASAGLEWSNASNTPFRRHKSFTFSGGTRTPFIVHWPAGISARGELRHQAAHVLDLMPTILEATATRYPETFKDQSVTPVEGISLMPVFEKDSNMPRELFWEHQGNKAVRQGHWKAIRSGKTDWQLFDLSADPTEEDDLAMQHPQRLEQLKSLWQEWARRCHVLK